MGLAASQCRLLVLTARKSDLEYRAQNITNRKLLLSAQTENIAMEYTRKLNNRQMRFVFDFNSNEMEDLNENLTINSIYTNNSAFIGQYRVRLADGRIAVSSTDQLPYTMVKDQSGAIIGAQAKSAQEVYESLSMNQKVQYLSNQISYLAGIDAADRGSALDSLYGAGSVANGLKEALETKVNSAGEVISTRSQLLDSMKDLDSSKLTDADKAALASIFKALSTRLEGSSAPNAGKDSSDTALSWTAGEGKALKDAMKLFNDTAHTVADADYTTAINAIKAYLNKVDTSKDSWLNAKVVQSAAGTDFTGTESTMMDYLKTQSEAYKTNKNDDKATTAQAEAYNNAVTALKAFINQNPQVAAYLIMGTGEFQQTCTSQGATVVSQQVKNSDGTYSEQLSLRGYDSEGNPIEYVVLPALENPEFFQNALRNGTIILEKFKRDNDNKGGAWTSVNIGAEDHIQDKLYTEDDAAAQAEYETQTAIIQHQDKMLDVELRQVETQQKACDNEYESVKKILDKNIERSFKVFS